MCMCYLMLGITPKKQMTIEEAKHFVDTYIRTFCDEDCKANDLFMNRNPLVKGDDYVHFVFDFSRAPLELHLAVTVKSGEVTIELTCGNTAFLDNFWDPLVSTTVSILRETWPALWDGYVKHVR